MVEPSRGEIWLVNLNPVQGREQSGIRPALVISVNLFNHGPAELVVVLPVTTKQKGVPFHIEIASLEGGLKEKSYVKCEDIRSISKDRLLSRMGTVTDSVIKKVEDRVRILLGL